MAEQGNPDRSSGAATAGDRESRMPVCPMGETCMRLLGRPSSRLTMFIPGMVFVALGVLVIIEPAILIWLLAALFILIGIAMLGGACFLRSMRAQFRGMSH